MFDYNIAVYGQKQYNKGYQNPIIDKIKLQIKKINKNRTGYSAERRCNRGTADLYCYRFKVLLCFCGMCGAGAGLNDSQIGGGGPGADGEDYLPVHFPCHEGAGNP